MIVAVLTVAATWLYNGYRTLSDTPGYLARRAAVIEQRRRDYPCLTDRTWLLRSNWWAALLLTHYTAPAALVFTGVAAKKRGRVLAGVLCIALMIAMPILYNTFVASPVNAIYLATRRLDYDLYFLSGAIQGAYRMANLVLLALIGGALFTGYDSYILARAQLSGGYADDFEAEQAAETAVRWNQRAAARNAAVSADPASAAPVMEAAGDDGERTTAVPALTEPVPAYVPVSAPAAGAPAPMENAALIDVNACREADYLALPGVTVADAKRAMQYRAQYGGFESTDAFVMALGLKPHFAARIFPLIAASPASPSLSPDAKPQAQAQSARHRVIDY